MFEENARLAIANIDNALSIPEVVSHTAQLNVSGMLADVDRTGNGSSSPSAAVTNSSMSTPTKTQVKLPKLELKKFDGDQSKWISFWDTFEASMHKNSSLSAIDKFNNLISLLERSAAEAVSGLTLTASNYDEAVELLKARFGNKQQIINRHMEILLSLDCVTSHHNIKDLRQLFDTLESNVRSLKALGVPHESYGSLLSSILMNKLPQDFRLVVTREMGDGDWQLDRLLAIFKRELEARERAVGTSGIMGQRTPFLVGTAQMAIPALIVEGNTHQGIAAQ